LTNQSGTAPEPVEDPAEAVEVARAMATRHELGPAGAKQLATLVGLLDWGKANFVPEPDANGVESARDPESKAARRDLGRFAQRMLGESLAALEIDAVRSARQIADIGSGAGFPGLVLAVALPQAHMTLIERVPAKCSFLRESIAELGLENTDVVEGIVQDWAEGAGSCDLVTSRRTGRAKTVVKWAAPLLAVGGRLLLHQRDRDALKEAAADAAAAEVGLRLDSIRKGSTKNKHLHLYVKSAGT
jgi:16S rRNA (guanine527-N7)-methyltransferase